jgi:hypothetical protein
MNFAGQKKRIGQLNRILSVNVCSFFLAPNSEFIGLFYEKKKLINQNSKYKKKIKLNQIIKNNKKLQK